VSRSDLQILGLLALVAAAVWWPSKPSPLPAVPLAGWRGPTTDDLAATGGYT
jgi:hypothetical protein